MIDSRHLAGDFHGKAFVYRKTGQAAHAALPLHGPPPLLLQVYPQGRNSVVADNHRAFYVHLVLSYPYHGRNW